MAAALAALACGAPGPEPPPAATPDARTSRCGPVPRALQGSYFMRTSRGDLPPELVDGPVGLHLLLVGPEHHTFLRVGDRSDYSWPVCVTGRLLRLPGPAAGACARRGPATYRWQRRGRALRLARVRDVCLPRVHALTARPYRWFNASGWDCHSSPDCEHKLAQVAQLEKTGSCASIGCSDVP